MFWTRKSSEDSVCADAVIYSETRVVRVRGSAFDWDSDTWMPPVKKKERGRFGTSDTRVVSGNEEEGGRGRM